MKLKVDAIVFDFDGVIIDSGRDIANAVCCTLQHYGRPVLPIDEIISYVGRGPEVLVRKSFKDCSEELIKEAIPYYKEYYLNNCMIETTLCKNVKATLEFFKNKNMAVVTNKPEDMTYKILDGLGVRDYFRKVIGPDSVRRLKPDPEGLLKAVEFFGADPERVIMVGDSSYDILAGKNAGTHTCGVTYGIGSVEEMKNAGPDVIIDDMIELTKVVE